MTVFARRILFVFLISAFADRLCASERLICCGGPEVFVINEPVDASVPPERLWRWQAKDSPEIPEAMWPQFRTTDECKPYDKTLLITSSSGGVALIRRDDKKCLFLASVTNAHSACLLPKDRIAVASSTGGDEVLVFAAMRFSEETSPIARLALKGAHGTVWDEARDALWALGTHELLLIAIVEEKDAIKLVAKDRWKLPTAGGHDLSWTGDRRHLYLTTNDAVYRFDVDKQAFASYEPLAKSAAVKSIDEHPKTGRVVYHQADHAAKVWWSDIIRLLDPDMKIQLPGERLYKVRWDVVPEKREAGPNP